MSISSEIEILLVEDDPSDAELTLRSLKKDRLTNDIVWVKDGVQALDFLFGRGEFAGRDIEKIPRLVLLDLNLPRMSGLDVLRAIKSDPGTRVIPVVVLTSSSQDKDIIDSYHLGVNSYIVKPVDFDKFCEAIRGLGIYWLLLNEPPPRARSSHTP